TRKLLQKTYSVRLSANSLAKTKTISSPKIVLISTQVLFITSISLIGMLGRICYKTLSA
ncbi:autotransporter beta-domain protein, partial [Chlamydia psittaci 03DC29]